MSDPKTDEERLAELLLQWEEILEQGRDVSAEELCRDCPGLVQELSRRIAALKAVDWVNKTGDTDNGDDGPCDPITPPDEPVAGRYRLDRFIAEGGFGQVWQGFDLELERTVAVKMPKASRLASVDKFMAEARRVAQLKHPGIVPVFDVVRDGGTCLIVSEYVEGGSLADHIGKLDAREVVRLIGEIAGTLHYAHQQGFIHRDIKPSNMLIDHHGRALLADFGIALSGSESDESSSIGTLAYMSPEQIEGKPVDHRSDLFSLGVVLVELLTGQRPFAGETPARLRERILAGNWSVSDLPDGMKEICQRCLARNLDERYADADSLTVDLQKWLQHPPRRKLWMVAVPVVLLLAVGGFFLSGHSFGTKETKPTPVAKNDAEPNALPKLDFIPLPATPSGPMPKAAEAVHRQAGELFNVGKIAEALPLLDRAAELDPTNAEIFKNRGIAHLNLGDFDLAVADLEAALKFDADHPAEYRKILGQIYAAKAAKLGQSQTWQEAIAEMDRAISNLPTADYFHRRASMYYNAKQFDQAIIDWTEAIRLEPSVATYYEHRGYALKAAGREDDSAKDFTKAGLLPKTSDSALRLQGTIPNLTTGHGALHLAVGIAVGENGEVFVANTAKSRIDMFNRHGRFLRQLGSESQVGYPHYIVLLDAERLAVTDQGRHRVLIFDRTGTLLSGFGDKGSGAGQFAHPKGIALSPSGNLLVADSFNHRIQIVTQQGGFVTQFCEFGSDDGQLNLPEGICVDALGQVYVSDTGNHRVQVFDSEGHFLRVFVVQPRQHPKLKADRPMEPHGIAVDVANLVYVGDSANLCIQVFDANGKHIASSSGGGIYAQGVAADTAGGILAVDYRNHRISQYAWE